MPENENNNTKSIAKVNSNPNSMITKLSDFDAFAEYILKSEYRKNFERKNAEGVLVAEKGDIVSCLVLGNELGISMMGSIVLGKKLNANSYFSVIKGRELGLSPITSISKIYNIDTQNGTVLSLAVDLISKAILDSGTKMEYVRDYEMTQTYQTLDKVYVGHYYNLCDSSGELLSNYLIYLKDITTAEQVSSAMREGKIVVMKKGYTYVTSLRLVRPDKGIDKTFHYSIQEATDAGLHVGFHSSNIMQDGKSEYVKGRSNWNSHPASMLRNRVTSIAGRIVVADVLQGAYSHEEVTEILNVDNIQNAVEVE